MCRYYICLLLKLLYSKLLLLVLLDTLRTQEKIINKQNMYFILKVNMERQGITTLGNAGQLVPFFSQDDTQ